MLRTQFEEELDKLHNQFYAMGTEVLAQINKTVRAFVSHDRDLAKEVIEDDEVINEYETKLEKKSLEIIALQQPVSQDLRTVITVLKASSDVERMGDHVSLLLKKKSLRWGMPLNKWWKKHSMFTSRVMIQKPMKWRPTMRLLIIISVKFRHWRWKKSVKHLMQSFLEKNISKFCFI